jgi:hypothetical protein
MVAMGKMDSTHEIKYQAGFCPTDCKDIMCKVYSSASKFSEGPCSCPRTNSDNSSSTYCEQYLLEETKSKFESNRGEYIMYAIIVMVCGLLILLLAPCISNVENTIPQNYLNSEHTLLKIIFSANSNPTDDEIFEVIPQALQVHNV